VTVPDAPPETIAGLLRRIYRSRRPSARLGLWVFLVLSTAGSISFAVTAHRANTAAAFDVLVGTGSAIGAKAGVAGIVLSIVGWLASRP
jgi:nucleoside phosphorylase